MNKEEIIEMIEQIGYEEFYRYYQEKDKYIELLKNELVECFKNELEPLQQENKILRENAEHNDKVVDKVNWENQLLKQRIDKANKLLIKFCNENQPYLDEIEDYCKTKIDSVLEELKR